MIESVCDSGIGRMLVRADGFRFVAMAADGGAWEHAVSVVGDRIGVDHTTAAILLIGIAILCVVPVLAVVGYLANRFARRTSEAETSGPEEEMPSGRRAARVSASAVDPAIESATVGVAVDGDGAATTMLVPGGRAGRDSDGGSADAKRVTTQALRAPPRAGAARIVVEYDGDDASGENASVAAARDAGTDAVHRIGKGSLTRIGREGDNEIVLSAVTVHRYHAVIRRTADHGFVVFDMSGPGGNGVYVNGERIADAQLGDGDCITLGTARLRFYIDV